MHTGVAEWSLCQIRILPSSPPVEKQKDKIINLIGMNIVFLKGARIYDNHCNRKKSYLLIPIAT